jgi:hypothetical protein
VNLGQYKYYTTWIDEFGLYYENIDIEIHYVSFDIDNKNAEVTLLLDVDYNYEVSPKVDSGIYNVQYKLALGNTNGRWKLIKIESDNLEQDVDVFVEDMLVSAIKSREAGLTKETFLSIAPLSDAVKSLVDSYVEERIADIALLKSLPNDKANEKGAVSENIKASISVPQSIMHISYAPGNGTAYALEYAKKPVSSRLFYTTGLDCTNFVSQCVWAGYGGYVYGNISKTKQNIKDQVRMTSTWYGGTGGGASKWESVDKFYNYSVSSKTYGPNATGVNNGNKWTSYPNARPPIGAVLQLRNGSSGAYKHSIYVTGHLSGPSSQRYMDLTQFSAHTTDTKNGIVLDKIKSFGGSNCYLRGLVFSSSKFES